MNANAMLEAPMTSPGTASKKPRGLRAVYAWMLANARGRHAWAAVAAFAFAEASFFPIPADIMVLPMMIADRKRVFYLGAWVAFWSVMGGMLGYAIGHLFWETAGLWLVHALHLPLEQVENLRVRYSNNAHLIMIQGRDADSIQAGHHRQRPGGVAFPLFMLYSAVTRSIRYIVIEASLVYFFGEKAKELLEKYLEAALVLFLIVLVLGFVALKYL